MSAQRVKVYAKPEIRQTNLSSNFAPSMVQADVAPIDIDWVDGTTVGTSNRFWNRTAKALSNASTDSWDLRALTDGPNAATVLLQEVRAILIRFVSGTTLTISKGASNGWTGLGASWTVTLKPGTQLWLLSPTDGNYATGASDKVIDILASGSCVYDVAFVGVSA